MNLLDECHVELIQEFNQLEELSFYLSENNYSDIKMVYALTGVTPGENSYEQVPVTQWNSQNSLDWGISVCRKHNLDIFTVDVGRLNNSCGSQLIQSSERDFSFILGDQYGPIFYREFQDMKKYISIEMQNMHTKNEEGVNDSESSYNYENTAHSPDTDDKVSNSHVYDSSQHVFTTGVDGSIQDNNGNINNNFYPCSDQNSSTVLQPNTLDQSDHSDMYKNTELYNLDDKCMDTIDIIDLNTLLSASELCHKSEKSQLNILIDTITTKKGKKSRKKNIKDVYVSEVTAEKITGKILGLCNRARQPKSWEFLMHLLVNQETNPDVVCWEDESNYLFRFVRKDKIVQLWNKKSEFTSHVYNNFARSLRYHYKRGVLVPVPEKQLVYRCGPKAVEYLNKIRKSKKLS